MTVRRSVARDGSVVSSTRTVELIFKKRSRSCIKEINPSDENISNSIENGNFTHVGRVVVQRSSHIFRLVFA
jgi:hypothetical protein